MIEDIRPTGRQPAPSASPFLPRQSYREPTPRSTEPSFQTPETAAAADPLDELTEQFKAPSQRPPKQPRQQRFHWPQSKKQWFIGGAGLIIVIAAGFGTTFAILQHQNRAVVKTVVKHSVVKAIPPEPTTVASMLTGLQVDKAINSRPVTGVMIENSTYARPQAGLKDAGVVFEAVAEGGITRFLALFQDTQPDYVGPVRSVRPYYLSWLMGFDASVAHVGGSPEALQDIKSWGVKDLDQFFNSKPYHRVSNRTAPHNMYTSIAGLNELEQSKGYTSVNYTGFARKTEAASKTPNATSINLTLSSSAYNVHYDYDAASNSYKRFEGGQPHKDDKSGEQLSPKVVVALVMNYALEADHKHYAFTTVGSGQAYVFQDGIVTTGTWSKDDNAAPLKLLDSSGAQLKLNPGQTWISVVAAPGKVSYK